MLNPTFMTGNGVRPPPYLLSIRKNDSLKCQECYLGITQLANLKFSQMCVPYWSQDSVERVTGWRPESGFIHLINS